MHIDWILEGHLRVAGGWYDSDAASSRYRALIPGAVLRRQGHAVKIHPAPFSDEEAAALAKRLPVGPDCVTVTSKLIRSRVAKTALWAKPRGVRLVADFCDDHFATPGMENAQLALARLAERIVVSTPALGAVVARAVSREASVVTDPFEGPAGTPRFAPEADRLRLMWVGHQSNIDTLPSLLIALAKWLLSDAAAPRRLEIEIVTLDLPGFRDSLRPIERRLGERLAIALTPWSTAATWTALARCDAVVIPSLDNAAKLVKSPNRVVEALRAGRFVAAHPVPAYREFARHAWIGEDVVAGLAWALANRDAALARVEAGQEFVAQRHAPDAVARAWLDVFESLKRKAA